jgi:hypothetical protein
MGTLHVSVVLGLRRAPPPQLLAHWKAHIRARLMLQRRLLRVRPQQRPRAGRAQWHP